MRTLAVAAIAGCPVFPASNPFNQRVDDLPVHASSDAIVRSIGLDGSVRAFVGLDESFHDTIEARIAEFARRSPTEVSRGLSGARFRSAVRCGCDELQGW